MLRITPETQRSRTTLRLEGHITSVGIVVLKTECERWLDSDHSVLLDLAHVAFIDGRGHVRERTPIFERGLLVTDVPLASSARTPTFYVRHGDVFALACWGAVAGLVIAGIIRSRNPRHREDTSNSKDVARR